MNMAQKKKDAANWGEKRIVKKSVEAHQQQRGRDRREPKQPESANFQGKDAPYRVLKTGIEPARDAAYD